MKAYVLMGNDFPEAVYLKKDLAEAEVMRRMEEQRKGKEPWETPRVYWRWYDFEIVGSDRLLDEYVRNTRLLGEAIDMLPSTPQVHEWLLRIVHTGRS